MYFLKNLYVGPSIHDPEKVKRNLISGAGQFTIYVICLSPSIPGPGANQLEILHCVNLQQPYYKKYPPYIIGIAEGMIEAVEMVRDLVQEAYDHTGSADVRAYLFPHGTRIIYPAHAAPQNLLPDGETAFASGGEAGQNSAEQEKE